MDCFMDFPELLTVPKEKEFPAEKAWNSGNHKGWQFFLLYDENDAKLPCFSITFY